MILIPQMHLHPEAQDLVAFSRSAMTRLAPGK